MCTWLNSMKELTRQVNILLLESKLHKDAYVLVVSQNKHHLISYFPDCVLARIQKKTLPWTEQRMDTHSRAIQINQSLVQQGTSVHFSRQPHNATKHVGGSSQSFGRFENARPFVLVFDHLTHLHCPVLPGAFAGVCLT